MHGLKVAAIISLCLLARTTAAADIPPVAFQSILTSAEINLIIAAVNSKLGASDDASATLIRPGANTVAQSLASYLSALPIPVEAFGVVCNGTADASVALNAAGVTMSNRGGGTLVVSGRCLIDATDLIVPESVRLTGSRHIGMQRQTIGYDNIKPTLLVNPARTVRLGNNAALEHVVVSRNGMITPVDMRTALTQLTAFAGTGITLNGVQDPNLEDVLILGFNRCIDVFSVNRLMVRNVHGDCNNGIRIDESHDVPRVVDTHFWPTLTANQSWTFPEYAISAAAASPSGNVRLTVPGGYALLSGDSANVVLPGVMIPAYVAITPVDATHLDLPTVAYTGAYTTGGKIIVDTTRRPGIAFEVFRSESVEIVDSFAYGYQTGVHQGTRSGWTHLINTSIDANGAVLNNISTGILVDDTSYGGSMLGGFISSMGTAVIMNAVPGEAQSFTGTSFNPGNGNVFQLVNGASTFTGNHAPLCCVGLISIANSSSSSIFVGNDFTNVTIAFEGLQARNRTTLIGNKFGAGVPSMQLVNSQGGFTITASDQGAFAASSVNVNGCAQIAGVGDPNTVQALAPVCTQYYRKDGGAGSTLYVKESGTGGTGWVAK